VGGFSGFQISGTYSKCFWDSTVNPTLPGIGNAVDPDVIAESTARNLQNRSTYIAARWDFTHETTNGSDDIWRFCVDGSTPRLAWAFLAGDFACPDGMAYKDFTLLSLVYGQTACGPGKDNCNGFDLDESGDVDLGDVFILALNWLAGT